MVRLNFGNLAEYSNTMLMDDIGNILYILAMLAALVFSAYKKQKQAKKQVPMPEDEQPAYHPMDEEDIVDELRELFQKPKVEKPTPGVKKPSPVKPAEVKSSKKVEVRKSKPVIKEEIKLEVFDEVDDMGFDKEQIDLRQAVIYSEILKRPYE